MAPLQIADLTPDAPPEVVLHLAGYLARNRSAFGALELSDYRSVACLAFYRARARWTGPGCFGSYVLRCMDGAIREAGRREAQQHEDYIPRDTAGPSSKGAHRSHRASLSTSSAGGSSASPTLAARTRRRISRREHNKTYYYRHVSLQTCERCGTHVGRGHGAHPRCDACAPRAIRYGREWRAQRRAAAAALRTEAAA